MIEVLQDYEFRPARPTFLTVLCILTFIGSSYSIISSAVKYFSADKQAAAVATMKEKMDDNLEKKGQADNQGAQMVKNMVGKMAISASDIRKLSLSEISGAVLCLLGAFMMWMLRKTGFYLYVAGVLLAIVAPFIILGGANFMSIISTVFVGFFGIAFVIMYGVNFKYLR